MDKFMVGVILIVKSDSVSSVEEKMMDTAAFVVPKPFNRQLLVQNVRFVLQSREKFQRLQKKNTELKAKIEDIGIVYRGKLFLMGYLDMTEDEAHRYIQKKAMDMRISPRKVAEQIIDTYSKKK
jgi:response regulator NasT